MKKLLPLIIFCSACGFLDSERISNQMITAIERSGVQNYDISVETKRNKAVLKGFVGSVQERELAYQAAMSTGLAPEVINQLEVRDAATMSASEQPLAESLISQVKSETKLRAYDLKAFPKNGMLTLSGTVDNLEDLDKVNNILGRFPYAGKVYNQVVIREPLSDDQIFSIALNNLQRINARDIGVTVTYRILEISGNCQSFEEADRILTALVGTPDLAGLVSNLSVKGAPYPLDQFKIGRLNK